VKGLNVGAQVVVNGAKVGSVTDIQMEFNPGTKKFRAKVLIETIGGLIKIVGGDAALEKFVDTRGMKDDEAVRAVNERLIQEGWRAQLDLQSMVTGQLMVSIALRDDPPKDNRTGEEPRYPEIPTMPTMMEQLTQSLAHVPIKDILKKLDDSLSGIESMVNSAEVRGSVTAIHETLLEVQELAEKANDDFAPMKADVHGLIEKVQTLVTNADKEIAQLTASLDETLVETRTLMRNVNEHVDPVATGLEGTLQDTRVLVRNVNEQVDPVATSLVETMDSAKLALDNANQTLAKLRGGFISESSPFYDQISTTLESLSRAMASIEAMTAYLERHPEALLRGKVGN
jgi:paraquat-inducible protein B